MSDQITTTGPGDNATFNVYYGAENRQKRIEWVSGSCTVRKLYSRLQDHFDELGQMDDGVPMSAQTPTEYTIGKIDAGDTDPWFIDDFTVEHLTGGAVKTASWDRTATNTGVVRVLCDNSGGTPLDTGDIGDDVSLGTNDGTLLDIRGSGTTTYLWIRPDTSAAGDDWDDSGTITAAGSSNTATWTSVADGETLWSNIYSIGTLEDESITHLYVIQDSAKMISSVQPTTNYDWWIDGHIDILVKVREVSGYIDEGFVTVFARHYTKNYDNYIVDLSNGGRNPIPLSTGEDLNNTTGYWNIALSGASGAFTAGNYLYVGATYPTATKKAVLTAVNGTTDCDYYLIGTLSNFANLDTVKEYDPVAGADTGESATSAAPSASGPAALAGVSITHGGATLNDGGAYDINEDGTPENYSIIIDCSDELLADVYEWTKWLTRRGEITQDANTDGMDGEQYIGSDYKIQYTSTAPGALTEGAEVTGATSGAKGTVVQVNETDKIVILRNSRGTFGPASDPDEDVTDGTNTISTNTFTRITPIKSAPLGTFAGVTWFCAPGVVLINVPGADANNYQLTDDDGNVVTAPDKITIKVTNTKEGDKIGVFRIVPATGEIDKDDYTPTAAQAPGETTLDLTAPIAKDEPGKVSPGAVLRLVDADAQLEYRIRYTSWSNGPNGAFVLSATSGTATGGDTDTLTDSGATFTSTAKVGDLIRNTTEAVIAYVLAVVSDTELTTTPVTSWSGDGYQLNGLPITTAAADRVYIPVLDVYEAGADGFEQNIVTYDIDNRATSAVRVRARHADLPENDGIIPYDASGTIDSTGLSNNIIRTPDTIFTP
ncbi:hypothetical protein A2890_02780 [candidate division WWE3 bacterium RIFCSPLOWO2_01_FULL_53_14]|uniref:Uncharacterized protein n=2 Tax=Katanobacteria TaxID=422282 RepID=A0A1F4VRX6_UNCKA|nr:MAG: hypothetical protein A2890_02780 [candidate division WWE3 bacterium RIFCSPLOWO2_01_FULL_53_14]